MKITVAGAGYVGLSMALDNLRARYYNIIVKLCPMKQHFLR